MPYQETKNCKLNQFFLKIQAQKGLKIAAVALARMVLYILCHLLVNRETYIEEWFKNGALLSSVSSNLLGRLKKSFFKR